MITSEKVLEWAKDAETTCSHPHGHDQFLEALINHAYAEGQKGMLEEVDNLIYGHVVKGTAPVDILGAVRELEIK